MRKILVADDERSIRETVGYFLKNAGYEVDMAADGSEALVFADEKKYDVVLADIVMPKLSGIELAAKLKEKGSEAQVIIMTGEPTVNTAINAIQQDVCDYLVKPFGKEILLKAVENAQRIKQLIDDKKTLEKRNSEYREELENKVFSRTAALHNAMEGIITLLSYTVEAKDMYTAGHQKRVGNIVAAIATKLGMPQKDIDLMRISGYIHDIGKIMVPSEILSKPGKLSKLEMDLIKEHSYSGYSMLKSVTLPEVIEQTIYMHHERCNGSGYPRGLKKYEISFEAKILMVADVVEAMMSHRPYRPALGIEAALDEIRTNSGILYDPEVSEACLELFEKDGYQIEEKTDINFPL